MEILNRKRLVLVAAIAFLSTSWMVATAATPSRSAKSAVSRRPAAASKATRKVSRKSKTRARTSSVRTANRGITIHNPNTQKPLIKNPGRKPNSKNPGIKNPGRKPGRKPNDKNPGRKPGGHGHYEPGDKPQDRPIVTRPRPIRPIVTYPRPIRPIVTRPRPIRPIVTRPRPETQPERPSPTTDPAPEVTPQPESIEEIPSLENIEDALEEYSSVDHDEHDPEEIEEVKTMAQKCLSLPVSCGWWIDFCCWNWWDWCSVNWYWNCWTPCYWNYVFCPQQVIVINGAPQVFAEISYYVGISGSQIPGFGFGIETVKNNSPAEWAGLVAGDVIVSVNGEAMTGHDVLLTALQLNDGVLNLEVVYEGSNEIQLVRVVAQRVRVSSF